ncbi:MAG: toll/interleukin-1 receptor domain-containing protein [Candidatus Nitrotoga sp.]|nr:toll/interleukin-1 receptor domain-containing protein [Candidatus Nitrotoga sp.]
MSEHVSNFELPRNIEHYLGVLSKLYAQEGKRQFQEVIVNAQIRVHEEWDYDNWNGGTYGHALFLILPEQLFLSSIKQKDDMESKITNDLNKLHNFQNEHISAVFLEMEVAEDHDWRKESGLLMAGKRVVPPDATKRIWGDDGFRVFFSHKSEVKKETAALKDGLRLFGISCFVAHEDIHPTQTWQDEIEYALASMDGFVALMTENFHDSDWTDQEVGFAVARGIPIIAVRLGKDPYGFIGKLQGLSSTWQTSDVDIVKVLIKSDQMLNAYIQALHKCPNWNAGNTLSEVLPSIVRLSVTQIDALIAAYNNLNGELRGSFGFNGTKSNMYGHGLVPHLNRLGTRQFRFASNRLIELVT